MIVMKHLNLGHPLVETAAPVGQKFFFGGDVTNDWLVVVICQ